jgi:hypothetical protein
MRNWTFEPGIELSGVMIESIVEAFKLFPSVALKRLVSAGIGTLNGREVVMDRHGWYPIDSWLAAFDSFATSVGTRALFQIGQQVPKYAVLPPGINDIHSAMASINIGYHMNHRKNGRLMFDPTTGQTLPGIGNYTYSPVPGERKIIFVGEVPYPCDFDRGLLSAFATKFERFSRVMHDDRAPCRKNGSRSCTYIVTW